MKRPENANNRSLQDPKLILKISIDHFPKCLQAPKATSLQSNPHQALAHPHDSSSSHSRVQKSTTAYLNNISSKSQSTSSAGGFHYRASKPNTPTSSSSYHPVYRTGSFQKDAWSADPPISPISPSTTPRAVSPVSPISPTKPKPITSATLDFSKQADYLDAFNAEYNVTVASKLTRQQEHTPNREFKAVTLQDGLVSRNNSVLNIAHNAARRSIQRQQNNTVPGPAARMTAPPYMPQYHTGSRPVS